MAILFTDVNPDFYMLSQIYDPTTNPTGQIIPRPNSIVIDPDKDNLLKKVASVDPVSFAVSYEPVTTSVLIPQLEEANESPDISLIDYGNMRLYLYFDTRDTPTKLTIDKKIVIIGDDAETYCIMSQDVNNNFIPISLHYDSNGVYVGNYVPLVEVNNGVDNLKYCPSCSTSIELQEDDVFYIHIFDYAGTQTGSIKIFGRTALVNNVLGDTTVIEGFTISGTQELGTEFYLYPAQDVDSLMLTPSLVYNTSTETEVPIDGSTCYIYGLENFIPSYPGQYADFLVKYFLGEFQQAVGSFVGSSGGARFLLANKRIRVLTPGDSDHLLKISAIPVYIQSQSRYTVVFVLYEIGQVPRIITQYVHLSVPFEGNNFTSTQALSLSFNLKDIYPGLVNDSVVYQNINIRLAPFTYVERYIISEPGDAINKYGVDSPTLARPVIYHDTTLQQYFVPTSKFPNVSLFLEAFYYKAKPLFDTNLSAVPIAPTHFSIRGTGSEGTIVTAPIAVDNYEQLWTITEVHDYLLNRNCIVEFLFDNNGTIEYLYGVPVDVLPGTHI